MKESLMSRSLLPPVSTTAVLVLASGLVACSVGPDFTPPAAPKAESYLAPGETSGKETVQGRIVGDWWRLFHASQLNRVVTRALAGSPSLENARARLAQAQDQLQAVDGRLYPQATGSAGAQRERINMAAYGLSGSTPVFNLYSLGPAVSYDFDLFGGNRRLVEQGAAQVAAAGYQLDGAYLVLTGAVVEQALTIASLRAQIQAVEAILDDDEKNLSLVRTARSLGSATDVDVLHTQSQLASDKTLLPPLEQRLAEARHALAGLVGDLPADFQVPDFDLSMFTLPEPVPVSLPSELVHQRPDILAAEADLHAASAAIGVAEARQYPSLTLTADLTQAAFFPGKLWNVAASTASAGFGLSGSLFDGGTLSAERKAAEDAYRASQANYRQVVIESFTQTADLLQALGHDREELAAQEAALAIAEKSLELTRISYSAGNVGVLQVLDAERQSEEARLGRIKAQARRQEDAARLMLAMGGGWNPVRDKTPG
jgi:NodT family efflux transporter outer membrane factor (OMF) lipoprotein